MVADLAPSFVRLPEDDVTIIALANRYRVSTSRMRELTYEPFMQAEPEGG